MYDSALKQMEVLRAQQPDSLTLTWLAAQLHPLKPDGGYWQAQSVWDRRVEESPDRHRHKIQAYKEAIYSRTEPFTKEWVELQEEFPRLTIVKPTEASSCNENGL
ncbi:hypothetical protein [Endozoicomonas numazuensis]|uniref:Uncharacterized protein n=1 Tax=Endozoicomonas numazuensis TaxID=1137799 RepID=A0A081NKX9_9GAMM|nr:hypothetical protein [Endozoicomonas numazuensis]KEQ19102.1 hypothetical protein GZ78_03585 [Endozoicomonas numazuensis]